MSNNPGGENAGAVFLKTLDDYLRRAAEVEDAKTPEQRRREADVAKSEVLAAQQRAANTKQQKRGQVLQALYAKFAGMEAWKLKAEAVPLILGRDPADLWDTGIPPPGLKSSFLFSASAAAAALWDTLQRAAHSEVLRVPNKAANPSEWFVVPAELVRFCKERGVPHHPELADAVKNYVPAAQLRLDSSVSEAHRKVLESGYTTPELEAAYAAVAQFWLKFDKRTPSDRPTSKQVCAWLTKNYGSQVSSSAIAAIDRLIRHPDAKDGGNLKTSKR